MLPVPTVDDSYIIDPVCVLVCVSVGLGYCNSTQPISLKLEVMIGLSTSLTIAEQVILAIC